MSFTIIVAVDESDGIGKGNKLPWRLSKDMAMFKSTTTKEDDSVVIMGRKTWASIPKQFRPLAGRTNVVLTRNRKFEADEGVEVFHDLGDALGAFPGRPVFVIGGGEIYKQSLAGPHCSRILLTRVQGSHGCDTFFQLPDGWKLGSESSLQEEKGKNFWFQEFVRE